MNRPKEKKLFSSLLFFIGFLLIIIIMLIAHFKTKLRAELIVPKAVIEKL